MWLSVVGALVSIAALVLFVATCVSLIRLSVYVRTDGRRYAVEVPEDYDESRPYRPRRRPRL
jgi:hypothetical protein